jgi:hypothetical protein
MSDINAALSSSSSFSSSSYIGLVGETCERVKVTSRPANVQVVLAGVTPTGRHPLTWLQHPYHFSRTSSHSF